MSFARCLALAATSLLALGLGTGCETTFTVYVEEGGEVLATWDGEDCTFWHEDGETKNDCSNTSVVFDVGQQVGTFEAVAYDDQGYSFGAWDGCDDETIPSVDLVTDGTVCTATATDVGIAGDRRTLLLGNADGDDDAWIVARFDFLLVEATALEPDPM